MPNRVTRARFVRLLSSAVIVQALLSAGSLGVGLILIRNTSDAQYGYYVLVLNALLLVTALQNQYMYAPMVQRMTKLDAAGRGDLVGGLFREQRKLQPIGAAIAVLITVAMNLAGQLSTPITLLVLAAIAASLATLYREFFRMVLLAYHQPLQVMRVDFFYTLAMVSGAFLATLTAAPATIAIMVLCSAAAISGYVLSNALNQHEPFNLQGAPGILWKILPVGFWTVAGSAIHWSFSQGYNYLIAGTLDVKAVAAAAATRLLMMPINMLSTGIGSLMLPTVSQWLLQHCARTVFTRLVLLCFGLCAVAVCYLSGVWLARDWIFTNIFHKTLAQRDLLLIMWSCIFVLMLFRDQLIHLLLARGQYRALTGLTLASAALSLTVSYAYLIRIGVVGALVGVMAGEILSVVGLVVMSFLEIRRDNVALSAQPSPG